MLDFSPTPPAQPGVHLIEQSVLELRPFIDWTPFFQTWQLRGSYPKILDHPEMGESARELFEQANAQLDWAERKHFIRPRAVVGLFPANAVGDDIHIYTDERRTEIAAVLPTLRQQIPKSSSQPNIALSDFIAPEGTPDWIGAFVVTAGPGVDETAAQLRENNQDMGAILIQSLGTGSRKRVQSVCTGWFAPSSGEWIRMRWLMASDSSQRTTGVFVRPPAIPRVRTTVRSR